MLNGTLRQAQVRRVGAVDVARYSQNDVIATMLSAEAGNDDSELVSQRWLQDSLPKRFIFNELYGDLLNSKDRRVLDVGGGLTALTRILSDRHRYHLVDIMAHDPHDRVDAFRASCPQMLVETTDWYAAQLAGPYDVVIANDLFPNVDQRLEMFLSRVLPIAREVRLSLTFYDEPRFYRTRRIDADEVLCVLAWNGTATQSALERFYPLLRDELPSVFRTSAGSLFANDRQVVLANLPGQAAND